MPSFLNRRTFLAGTAAAALVPPQALAAPFLAAGVDAAHYGVRPGAPDEQTARLQRAINEAARSRLPLWLAPGVYRSGNLQLPAGAQLMGVRGATRLTFTQGPSLLACEHGDSLTLSGLTLDGGKAPLPRGRALVDLAGARTLRITDCEVTGAGGNGVSLRNATAR